MLLEHCKGVHCVDLGESFQTMSLLLNLLFKQDSYSNAYLLAKFGFDTAENEPCKVCLTPPRSWLAWLAVT